MNKLISCEFNIDTAYVELRFTDGSMVSIDCTAVEYEVAHTIRQRSELDWLVYNDPVGYADLMLNGDPVAYLKNVTE
jgi:hypothetical protein